MRLKNHLLPLSLGAAFFIIGLLRLNDLSLYTDSTRYVLWANSLAHLKGFVDDSLPIPSRFVMNAPLYAILLVPSQLLASLSIVSAKVLTLLFGALSVSLFFQWLRRSFGMALALGGTLFFALNPMMLVLSSEVLSEAPFVLAWIILLVLMERQLSGESTGTRETAFLFSLLALIPLIREVAIAIVAAAIVHYLSRKEYRKASMAFVPGVVLYLLWVYRTMGLSDAGHSANIQYMFQHFATPADSWLLHEFVARLILNFKGYLSGIGTLVFCHFPNLAVEPLSMLQEMSLFLFKARLVLAVVLISLVAFGMILDLRTSASAFFRILSVIFYLLILFLYPVHDLRFLFPLLPLLLFFALQSVKWLSGKFVLSGKREKTLAILGWSLVLFPNTLCDLEILRTTMTYRSDPLRFTSRFSSSTTVPGYYRNSWSIAGDWITASIPEGAVIASPAKEIATFVRNHKVLEVPRAVPTPFFERLLRDNDVEYLITSVLWGDLKTYEFQMNESRRFWFEHLNTIGDVSVLKVHSTFAEPNPNPKEGPPLAANPAAADYLRFGRYDFMNLQYSQALLGFTLARNERPRELEPHFNILVVHSAISDTAGALMAFQALSGISESTPYIPLAQVHLNLGRLLRGASEAQNPYDRFTRATNAAIMSWNLGYPRLALRIASNVIKFDSTFFDAHLWASHFARQLGDTLLAYRHLRALERIDGSAPIVKDFQRVRMYEDSLRRARTVTKKVNYHRALSQIYGKLELREESIDELQRARDLDPHNPGILLDLGRAFEQKGAPFAAQRMYNRVLEIDPGNSDAREMKTPRKTRE